MGHVDVFMGFELAPEDVKHVSEDSHLVCFAVVIGVFKDQDFIIRLAVSRLVVRIAGHSGDPESAFAVEGRLNRISEFREFSFGCEELHFKAGSNCHGFEDFFTAPVVKGLFGVEVGFDRREGAGGGIGCGEIEILILDGGMGGCWCWPLLLW